QYYGGCGSEVARFRHATDTLPLAPRPKLERPRLGVDAGEDAPLVEDANGAARERGCGARVVVGQSPARERGQRVGDERVLVAERRLAHGERALARRDGLVPVGAAGDAVECEGDADLVRLAGRCEAVDATAGQRP